MTSEVIEGPKRMFKKILKIFLERVSFQYLPTQRNFQSTWSKSRSPFLLRFDHGPILIQINLQHSQSQPYGICPRVNYLTQTNLYVEHYTEKQLVVSTSFKVLGMTQPRVD